MFLGVCDRPIKTIFFPKGYREKINSIFFSIFLSEFEEFRKILMRGDRQSGRVEGYSFLMSKEGRSFESHVIAARTFLSSFRSFFISFDIHKKTFRVILSFTPFYPFDLTDMCESTFPFLIFASRMNIRIIPECEYFILFLEIEYRNRRIRTTTDMKEELWFLF